MRRFTCVGRDGWLGTFDAMVIELAFDMLRKMPAIPAWRYIRIPPPWILRSRLQTAGVFLDYAR
jgi:hypothetical protein